MTITSPNDKLHAKSRYVRVAMRFRAAGRWRSGHASLLLLLVLFSAASELMLPSGGTCNRTRPHGGGLAESAEWSTPALRAAATAAGGLGSNGTKPTGARNVPHIYKCCACNASMQYVQARPGAVRMQ